MRVLIICLFIPISLFAQFTDDFEDGDISNWTESSGSRWSASGDSPLSGSFSLHHIYDNTLGDHDQISVMLPTLDLNAGETKWKFKIKYDYNPSGGNNWNVFLSADADASEMFPSGAINGYVLGVNFAESDDTLRLYKIESGNSEIITSTTLNWDDDTNPSDTSAIEVTRSSSGDWEIKYNSTGDFGSLSSIGTGNDNSFSFANYFGIYYLYTSSADRKLWIDDIEIIGQIFVDNDPPFVDSLMILSSNSLKLNFSELIDSALAVDVLNYNLDKGVGNPDSVKIDELKKSVNLYFTQSLVNKTYYNIDINNLDDLYGNTIKDTSLNFLYYNFEKFDLVINEIMADPTPEVNLPNYEYVEIKNTTEFEIDLSGWKLKVGSSVRNFPGYVLDSGSYLNLCSATAAEFLDDYGEVLEFSSFPSITNSGTSIVIFDENNLVIDSVNFTNDWYNNTDKDDGGWSLERIDPLNTCSTKSNWKASENAEGGTPGFENSVFASNIDIQSPEVKYLEVISENQIKIVFSEAITNLSLLDELNYSVSSGIGNPVALIPSFDLQELSLVFEVPFPPETNLTITLANIDDECGNLMALTEIDFLYYVVKPNDIVINEIMADPEPAIELPEYEYIEIYNTADFEIDLTGWKLIVGTSVKVIPSSKIGSGEYIVLCDYDAEQMLQTYSKTISFSSFPSIPNTEQTLTLLNKSGQTINTIYYTNDWYKDDYKAEGGWSLEQIDPMNPCGGEYNWVASESDLGGTPGIINSVNASNPDLDAPKLLNITLIENNKIRLFFNESIDSLSAMTLSNYAVDYDYGNPTGVKLIGPDYKSLFLTFNDDFSSNTIYTCQVFGVSDCAGNEISGRNTVQFGVSEVPILNDIVINEVLFNPYSGGYDFVEIYNRSEKIIDLKDVFVASYNLSEAAFIEVNQISELGYLLFPEDYMVLSENPENIKSLYYTENPNGFISVSKLPSLNDDEGRIILTDKVLDIIDDFEYTEDMQFALLASKEGVSLERINFDRPTNDKTNWHSASEMAGFATPAYENSQFLQTEDVKEIVQVEPEVFSPDNDGFEDFANIKFVLSEPGYVANIKIYDAKGRLVRYLSNNQLLGVNEIITWDGLDENNQKTKVGVYVIFVELFDLKGNVTQYKETVVVAAKW